MSSNFLVGTLIMYSFLLADSMEGQMSSAEELISLRIYYYVSQYACMWGLVSVLLCFYLISSSYDGDSFVIMIMIKTFSSIVYKLQFTLVHLYHGI